MSEKKKEWLELIKVYKALHRTSINYFSQQQKCPTVLSTFHNYLYAATCTKMYTDGLNLVKSMLYVCVNTWNAYVQLFVLYYTKLMFFDGFFPLAKKNFNWNSFGNSVESVCFGLNESNIAKHLRKKTHSYNIFAQFDGAKVFLCAFYCIMESANNLSEMIFIVCSFVWSGTHKTMHWTNGHILCCFFSRQTFLPWYGSLQFIFEFL